jgi:structural maintenance of chromosome 4
MKSCKDQFKEFERKDVKYREDLKHLKQNIKKLDDKAEKVILMVSIVTLKL